MASKFLSRQQRIVSEIVSSGRYPNEEAVLTEALELLHQRDRLCGLLADGIRQLDAGERVPALEAMRTLRSSLPSAE